MAVVAVVGLKGGIGKSTLAVHLAGLAAQDGARVAFVDADPNGSSSRFLAEAAPALQIERMQTADDILEGVPKLAAAHDVVVIDAPGGDDEAVRAILLVASAAVLPTGAGAFDLHALARTVRVVRQAQSIRAGAPIPVVVLNRLRTGSVIAREAAAAVAQLGVRVAPVSIPERVGLADAVGQGRFAWDHPPARDAARELIAALRDILTTCNLDIEGTNATQAD